MREKVTADPVLQEKLKSTSGLGVDLLDESGQLIGHFVSADRYKWLVGLLLDQVSDEERDRLMAEPGEYTMDDVRRLFAAK